MSLFGGLFDLPWWGYALVALGLTHLTILAVTIFLHRNQTHRAIELHPAVGHAFRLWLWLTTGMRTREWVAVHRKHHAYCEREGDPHSPKLLGLNRVLWGGVLLYVKESANPDTIARYGHLTPDDWLERNLYSRYVMFGLTLTGIADVILFGIVPGVLIFVAQIAWIPFWAAGVINGIGHHWGYRNWSTDDASTNMFPLGLLIGGEELHNNHHAYPTSARFSSRWYEIDAGWAWIRLLAALGLAQVKRLPPAPRFAAPTALADLHTLEALIAHRYDALNAYDAALGRLPHEAREARRTMQTMKDDLIALWGRSLAGRELLVGRLQDWCRMADASGIAPLAEFSRRLRSYA
jgi:stearoyl-CoA desaturase (delta-9 desaturase)